jgi:hypothetical protein
MKSKFLFICLISLLLIPASLAALAPIPASTQSNIRKVAGAEAYVPTRLVPSNHYSFRTFSFDRTSRTLSFRFSDLWFSPAHNLYVIVTPFQGPLSGCGEGKIKIIQYDGNRVYWDGTNAWRCIAGPRGQVKVSAYGKNLPDVGLAQVIASVKRIY